MNRYPGSKEDSERQQGERSQRAARRYLRNAVIDISLTESDAEYLDCESDTSLLNVDGTDDVDEPVMAPTAAEEAARIRAENLVKPFEDQDFDDDAEAWKKSLSFKFNRHDPQFWVNNVEAEMTNFGINSQWSRRNALMGKDILPEDVIEELKPLLRLSKAESGPHIYKDIRNEILNIYSLKEEQAFERAASRRLTTRPSALGKQLINDISIARCKTLSGLSLLQRGLLLLHAPNAPSH